MDWNELANTRLGEIERPPLKPVGHYKAIFTGRAEQGNSRQKQTPQAVFPVQVLEPMQDVDADELAAAGGVPFKGETTFYFTPQTLWRFQEFTQGMGGTDEMNIPESLEYLGSCGEPFVLEVRHDPDRRDPSNIFLRFENPVPLSKYEQQQG